MNKKLTTVVVSSVLGFSLGSLIFNHTSRANEPVVREEVKYVEKCIKLEDTLHKLKPEINKKNYSKTAFTNFLLNGTDFFSNSCDQLSVNINNSEIYSISKKNCTAGVESYICDAFKQLGESLKCEAIKDYKDNLNYEINQNKDTALSNLIDLNEIVLNQTNIVGDTYRTDVYKNLFTLTLSDLKNKDFKSANEKIDFNYQLNGCFIFDVLKAINLEVKNK